MSSAWMATSPETKFPKLQGNYNVDVAIVGGGITAITAAALLKLAGKTVAIVEMSTVATGETGYTTAHLTEAIDTRYKTLIEDFGREGARLASRSSRAAIEQIENFISRYNISCAFKRCSGYLYTENPDDVDSLMDEVRAARDADIDANWIAEIPQLPFKTFGGVHFTNQAQFHPRQYLLPLVNSIAGNGSHVFENSRVTNIKDDEPCLVETEGGKITCHDVIVAANAPVSNWLFLNTKVAAYRTYAIAVRPRNAASVEGLFWDTADPYNYIRDAELPASKDDPGGKLLIIGGRDHKTGQRRDTDECFRELENYADLRFGVQAVPYKWSGQILEPIDGLPYIGLNSMSEHEFIATGFSGNGMTFGTFAGMLLSDLILGNKNPWTELYDATRIKPVAGLHDFLTENIDFPAHFIADRFAKPEGFSITDLSPGEGKLLRIDGQRMAVYRSDDDTIHACSPVCPHMGCYVQWNKAEKSWDCPCHGSRFDPEGKVVNGPATNDLKPLKLPEEAHAK